MAPEEAEPRRPRPRRRADVRFYVDEDILGLGYAMMWARTDTVTCGETLVEDVLPRETHVAGNPGGPWWLNVTRSGVRNLDYGTH